MGDLKDPRAIYAKGFLFLFAGALASLLLLAEHPTLKVAILLAMAVWCFARFYYFAFYVIEHYVDPQFRFAGLGAFVVYLITGRASVRPPADPDEATRQGTDDRSSAQP
ncbi:MAG TPA: hypothetical protein VHB77_16395 [Planctomycetaceae bacterium]|nr:hypothetical protein [Planctomycetaceae bacterium]